MLRNFASGNGYANQFVAANGNNFGIGAVGTANSNVIEQNVVTGNANGIFVTANARANVIRQNIVTGNPPLQVSQSFTTANCVTAPCTAGDIRNVAPAGTNTIEDNHCITVVTTPPFSTPPCRIFLPAANLAPLAVGLAFDSPRVSVNGSFQATFTGSNLTGETYFDIRVRAPGSTVDAAALNWQQGLMARHVIAQGTAVGDWRITGVRAHQDANEHTGSFAPVEATISVFVSPFGF